MARIICDADPFCYGPAATLLAVVKQLLHSGHSLTFIGTGTALELARRQEGMAVMPCDTGSTADCLRAIKNLGGADLFLSVLGDASVRAANELEIPVAYIDVLFWAWPSAQESHLRDADLYFVENDFEAEEKLNQIGAVIRNPILVGPIIDTSYRGIEERNNDLLVTYGGVDSPSTRAGIDTRYHLILTGLLFEALRSVNPFDQIWVAAGGRAIEDLTRYFGAGAAQFVSLSHDDFLRRLATSRCLLTQPGLSTPLEAFAYETPAFFIPPMNYTQVLQMRRFGAEGAAPYQLSWDTLDPSHLIPEGLPEPSGIAEVLKCISILERNNEWRGRVRASISDFISLPPSLLATVTAQQSSFFKALGADGSSTVAAVINSFLIKV